MSDELKEAVNNQVFLNGGATTYEDMLAAAREKVPASPIKAWMVVVAAVVVAIVIFCKKRTAKITKE